MLVGAPVLCSLGNVIEALQACRGFKLQHAAKRPTTFAAGLQTGE